MPIEFLAQVRAHAHALVRMARSATDQHAAAELERLALEILKFAHDFERRLGPPSKPYGGTF
jgi:hypothetical protein